MRASPAALYWNTIATAAAVNPPATASTNAGSAVRAALHLHKSRCLDLNYTALRSECTLRPLQHVGQTGSRHVDLNYTPTPLPMHAVPAAACLGPCLAPGLTPPPPSTSKSCEPLFS